MLMMSLWERARAGVRRAISGAVRGRSVRAAVAVILFAPYLSACFHQVPVSRVGVASGSHVSLQITDQGRIALTESVGPGIQSIDGRVLESTDSSVVLAVASIRFFDLQVPMPRDGERMEIAHGFFSEVRERRLSRSRSFIAAGLAAAGTFLLLMISIEGFGGNDPSDRPPPGDGDVT
jgi:hypothetical protein